MNVSYGAESDPQQYVYYTYMMFKLQLPGTIEVAPPLGDRRSCPRSDQRRSHWYPRTYQRLDWLPSDLHTHDGNFTAVIHFQYRDSDENYSFAISALLMAAN